jgi:predicted amidophosphoribosyltransferase
LPLKFSRVDPLSFSDHFHLERNDVCYYLGEYTARQGYTFSPTNRLILNLKKKPTAKSSELYWKQQAISEAARALRAVLASDANLDKLRHATLIPIPPSSMLGDPLYDDRVTKVLREMGAGLNLDIRELVKQRHSMVPVHRCEDRPRPEDLVGNYTIDEELAEPAPQAAWIFDDLLVAGSHFKAVQRVLCGRFPGIPTIGVFVARRVPETDELL